MNLANEIIRCPGCGTQNRIRTVSIDLMPKCGRCGTTLQSNSCNRDKSIKSAIQSNTVSAILGFALLFVVLGSIFTPYLIADHADLLASEQTATRKAREANERAILELENRLDSELSDINAETLRSIAHAHYMQLFNARRSYAAKYALTPREKAQLKMRKIAGDSSLTYKDAIKAVATEASPGGADVDVSESDKGIILKIDFDMSELTSGEHGVRTKHDTMDSLKKEVIFLVSRVTNDMFQFCRDLELETILVGCRHHVQIKGAQDGPPVENIVLYRILISRTQISELESNPFLDIYSTRDFAVVEVDKFDEIEIMRLHENR